MAQLTSLPPVAKSVLYNCKKCGTERYHRVLTHTSSTTAKIECEICKSKKSFNLETQKKAASAPKTSAASKKRASKTLAPSQWEELNNRRSGGDNPTTYSIKVRFAENQVIEHSVFGVGFVIKVIGQKIEVVFQDQIRQLVHDR